ncbi:MAG: glutamate 5-kinase, partial [Spirochaetales bacterium]|nr:glutamate 5-kinase [Spirochaetales bacterium]
RDRWIMQSAPNGTILIDEGAVSALKKHKSLLPSGVIGVEGVFEQGTVVMINKVAKAVPSFNSREIEELIGVHSSSIRDKIGSDRRDVIARPEDIVFID